MVERQNTLKKKISLSIDLTKEDIHSTNINLIVDSINQMEANQSSNKWFASIELHIFEEDEPDSNQNMTKMKLYFTELVKKLPYFLFYINPTGDSHLKIITYLADDLKSNSKEEPRLSGKIGYKMIEAIEDHVNRIGFESEHEGLLEIYQLISDSIKEEDLQCGFL
ncbi:hypothetical protein GCM10011351_06590 [Paraliobacillus quinghaiensis]|uniref:Uncharacterized protein n=1 Tax=Paraliobacillus quinghaiensis TaxID=470815 RepID=A0A917WRP3_9BACI|nr:hypothetical protein [Paraliobacillus quinghaiensis]GGM23485.1 hypothetical protein GCM10011351_06590 [Paraliobacillus quinghaiensis]